MANDTEVRPVVVGVDGSTGSLAALRWAVEEAERRRCPVEALLAYREDFGMVIGAVPSEVLTEMTADRGGEVGRRVLDRAITELSTDVEVRAVLTSDDPRHALTRASESAVLLVVGSGSVGPIRAALLGSVSAHCARHASCPVVVLARVRVTPAEPVDLSPKPARSATDKGSGVMNRSDTKPIVVGVDGSPAATAALRWALDEAGIRGCPVHVVNAWDYEPLADWAETSERRTRALSEALVEEVIGEAIIGRSESPLIVRRCLRGTAAEVLESAASDAALLVVASHTGHRLLDIVLGSTSSHCVLHATVPVVVIPAQGAPSTTKIAAGHAADHG